MGFTNLGWNVSSQKIYSDGNPSGIEKKRAIFRADNNTLLNISSDQYDPIQNSDIIESVMPLVECYKEKRSSVFSGGKRCSIRIHGGSDAEAEVAVGDVVSSGVDIRWSHDGSSGLKFQPFLLRLVCRNGMTSRQLVGRSLRIMHSKKQTKDFKEKVKKFYEELLVAQDKSLRFHVEVFKKWQGVQIKAKQAESMAKAVFKQRQNPLFQELVERREKRMFESWKELYETSSTISAVHRGRLWGVYNSFTEFFSHKVSKKAEQKLLSGETDNDLLKVFNFCETFAKEVA